MLKGVRRYCDLCDREIMKGHRYIAAIIERDLIPVESKIADTGLAVDRMGNIQADLCLTCSSTMMTLSGEERVC